MMEVHGYFRSGAAWRLRIALNLKGGAVLTQSLAIACLIPQMGNAERLKCPLDAYPILRRIRDAARALPAFAAADPDRQPDAR